MDTLRVCLECQTPLTIDAPQGLCPACLLKRGLEGSAGTTGSAPSETSAPQIHQKFGDYRIIRLLGRGGMGEVYEAEHEPSGRRVALKVMGRALNSETDRKRFLREGRLAASISHPHVVYVFGSEEIAGRPVIAMELVPGGTLKDRVRKEGRLTVAEAVDATLQMIDGLEAAHRTGILHRDIKPANCFMAPDGTVKVGDFGLSISTIARGETLLTSSGSILGTPSYASPEQLRGEELDVASDIYSVGASLYFLLTGRPPHEAQDLVKLITEVLDKSPLPPRAHRPELPDGLCRVIMRCLAKDRAKRFKNYGALRQALLPFSSIATTPATVGLRFVAGVVDDFIAFGPSWIFMMFYAVDPMQNFVQTRTLETFGLFLIFYLWYLLYYAVPEGLRGASLGKTLCRLRVAGPDGQAPGIPRALGRVFLYGGAYFVPTLLTVFFVSASDIRDQIARGEGSLTDWVWLPLWLLLFATMRRANGYAAVHDLVTKTRVITREAVVERQSLVAQTTNTAGLSPSIRTAETPGKCGVYDVPGTLAEWGANKLLLGHDEALRRSVWIHIVPPGSPPVGARRRDVSRAGRLRWLNGARSETEAWDAYEAVDGAALLNVVATPQPWSAVRLWLLDLAEELDHSADDPALATLLNPDRVWITSAGHAMLLDFPSPAVRPEPPRLHTGMEATSIQQFLDEVACRALGHPGAWEKLPLHARVFLTSLHNRAFESVKVLIGNLRSLATRMAGVSRGRRLASLFFAPLGMTLLGVIGAFAYTLINEQWDRTWSAKYPEASTFRLTVSVMASEWDDESLRKQFEIYVAGHYRPMLTNKAMWEAPETAAVFDSSARKKAIRALERYPNPTAEELAAAETLVRPAIDELRRFERRQRLWFSIGFSAVLLLVVAVADLIIAAAFRQPMLLRPFGLAVVTRNGALASRLRLFCRAAIAWLPLLIAAPFLAGLAFSTSVELQSVAWIYASILLSASVVWLAGTAWVVSKPTRGPQDWLSGTVVVPR